jgi:hypothetical protein
VITNTGVGAARNIRFTLESVAPNSPHNWDVLTDGSEDFLLIERLPSGQSATFGLRTSFSSASKVKCDLVWEDSRGEVRDVATLRLL